MEQQAKKRGRVVLPKASKTASKAQEKQVVTRVDSQEREGQADPKKAEGAGEKNLERGRTDKGGAGSTRIQSKSPGASSAAVGDGNGAGTKGSDREVIDGRAEVQRGKGRPREQQQQQQPSERSASVFDLSRVQWPCNGIGSIVAIS